MNSVKFAVIACALCLTACNPNLPADKPTQSEELKQLRQSVVKSNADMAYANYLDSLNSARTLVIALEQLVKQPSQNTLDVARQTWIAAREPYGQTEVFRFRQGPIDTLRNDGSLGSEGDGPEGRINAWPLGEALIDYVALRVDGHAGPENPANRVQNNIIANITDFPAITPEILSEYFEYGEDERNVTTGYHAIEFLLWGQDMNEGGEASALRDNTPGQRPYSDYQATKGQCTSGPQPSEPVICQRRGAYLLAAGELLVEDLERLVSVWHPESGQHYQIFISKPALAISRILEGMGRLSYGELAGERMNIALSTDSQEDEHSCFSDNTHRDIYLNAQGIQNSYLGRYTRINGETFQGSSLYQLLLAMGDKSQAEALKQQLEQTMKAAAAIDAQARQGRPFDVLIQQGVAQPEIRSMISSLVKQTDGIEEVIQLMKVNTGELRQDTQQQLVN